MSGMILGLQKKYGEFIHSGAQLVLLAVGLVLTLGLAIAGTIWLVRRRRGGLALLGWFALFALLLTLAQL